MFSHLKSWQRVFLAEEAARAKVLEQERIGVCGTAWPMWLGLWGDGG